MVAEISFCPCVQWVKHCSWGAGMVFIRAAVPPRWGTDTDLQEEPCMIEIHTIKGHEVLVQLRSEVKDGWKIWQQKWGVAAKEAHNSTRNETMKNLQGEEIQKKWDTRLYFVVLCPSLLHCSNAAVWFTLYGSLHLAAPSLQTRRYSSMARIHSMTIEAPITKVSPEHRLAHKLQSFKLHSQGSL